MNLRQLVGKKVIRTKPMMDKNLVTEGGFLVPNMDKVVEIPDYSFCDCHDTIIEVLDVVQNTPIVKVRVRKGGAAQEFSMGYVRAITGQLDDDNWKDVTEVIERVNKENLAIKDGLHQDLMNVMCRLGGLSGCDKSMFTGFTSRETSGKENAEEPDRNRQEESVENTTEETVAE